MAQKPHKGRLFCGTTLERDKLGRYTRDNVSFLEFRSQKFIQLNTEWSPI